MPCHRSSLQILTFRFPQSKLLDRATYRSGEIAYAKNDFDGAITQYQQLLEKFPQSPLVPNALYSLGIHVTDLPLSAEKVLNAIDSRQQAKGGRA